MKDPAALPLLSPANPTRSNRLAVCIIASRDHTASAGGRIRTSEAGERFVPRLPYGTNPNRGLTKKIPAKPPVTGMTPLLK